jgi:C1A family cysteine protease
MGLATNTVDLKVAMKRYDAPLYVMVYVDASFYAATAGKTITGPGTAGPGHAILIVGWDDSRRAWRIRNSWGSGWCDGGYAWLSYDYRIQEAWTANRPPGPGGPSSSPGFRPKGSTRCPLNS